MSTPFVIYALSSSAARVQALKLRDEALVDHVDRPSRPGAEVRLVELLLPERRLERGPLRDEPRERVGVRDAVGAGLAGALEDVARRAQERPEHVARLER